MRVILLFTLPLTKDIPGHHTQFFSPKVCSGVAYHILLVQICIRSHFYLAGLVFLSVHKYYQGLSGTWRSPETQRLDRGIKVNLTPIHENVGRTTRTIEPSLLEGCD